MGLRQAKVVHADACLTYNYSMIINSSLYSILMTVNELAKLLTPIGCDPRASRTPINNGVPGDGVSTLCGAVSTRGITVLFLGLLEL